MDCLHKVINLLRGDMNRVYFALTISYAVVKPDSNVVSIWFEETIINISYMESEAIQ